jgi:hypothetical protein
MMVPQTDNIGERVGYAKLLTETVYESGAIPEDSAGFIPGVLEAVGGLLRETRAAFAARWGDVQR